MRIGENRRERGAEALQEEALDTMIREKFRGTCRKFEKMIKDILLTYTWLFIYISLGSKRASCQLINLILLEPTN